MTTIPTYINIYAATLAFPVLNSIALIVLAGFMLTLGWLLIEQNEEIGMEHVQAFLLRK